MNHHHHNLRLTPSNSPFFKNSQLRSPTKVNKSEEPGLRLKRVIGTTTASANGFDCLPATRQFAYTAGAAAVVATVEDDLNITQRFFRAKPHVAAGARDANGAWPISPIPADPRSRILGSVRDQSGGGGTSPLGTPGRDWSDSPGGKTVTAKDRVKAATSVALSPNGKWLAVGETGYKPRVLVFSNKGESSESPVSVLAEHTFGVHALAFSPDSRYLASLGTVNDGFLYLWSIDDRNGAAALHASNKCTVTINSMTWVGQSLLTVGLRFVKLWRPDEEAVDGGRNLETASNIGTPKHRASEFGNSILSPKHKVLQGKNILLGGLLDANFLLALPISIDQAIICAESGEICFLHDSDKTQTLTAAATVDFRITSARLDEPGELFVTGATSFSKKFDIQELEQRTPTPAKSNRRQTISPQKLLPPDTTTTTTTAMATIDDTVVELDSKRHIRLTRSGDDSGNDIQVASHQLTAHDDAVLGVQALDCEILLQAAFLTFAGNGAVHLWDAEGTSVSTLKVPIETSSAMYDLTNELRAVAHIRKASMLAAGDKYGVLSLLDISTGSVLAQVRAHSAEVVQIVSFERCGMEFIATASRDRTVQLFAWNGESLDLLQTMDEHAAAVNGLLVAKDGEAMLSCSSDRTVVVREAMLRVPKDPTSLAYVMLRTISLKASPTSMCLTEDTDEILVSTVDRCIGRYNIKTGHAGFTFKCSDAEGGEAASMSKILYTPSLNGDRTIMGVCSSDKSVRLYSEHGSLMARDWGHTEGITDIALLASHRNADEDEQKPSAQLITVAADSTIFMWDTVSSNGVPPEVNGVCDSPIANKLTPMAPPLRKVISYSELSRFKRENSIDENEPSSPSDVPSRQRSPSPQQRVKKKSSRVSLAQPPRLEPAFRSGFADSSNRRRSLRKRSPSPPSPRTKRDHRARRPSLGMSLRSKSSENVLSSLASGNSVSAATTTNSSFGSLTASTESMCRTLRVYRKKLANSARSDTISPETLRELEKEMKLLARVVGEKSQGKNLDEAMMARLLDQASDKIVSRLDERIKERVESEVRKSGEGSPAAPSDFEPAVVDAVAGALERVMLE